MKVLRSEFFPFEPQAAKRSVQTQNWLTGVSYAKAKETEDKFNEQFDGNGNRIWVKKLKKGGTKTLRSKPNYVRTKKYLEKYLDYKDALREHGKKAGFIMPQDAFFMWFFMPMPKSWTKKKKAEMAFKLHKNKKDTDNLSKAIKDALAPRKSNFLAGKQPAMDDRVISSYANAKIYLPDEYADKVGTLIVEYDVSDFLNGFFFDAILLMNMSRKELPQPLKFA